MIIESCFFITWDSRAHDFGAWWDESSYWSFLESNYWLQRGRVVTMAENLCVPQGLGVQDICEIIFQRARSTNRFTWAPVCSSLVVRWQTLTWVSYVEPVSTHFVDLRSQNVAWSLSSNASILLSKPISVNLIYSNIDYLIWPTSKSLVA